MRKILKILAVISILILSSISVNAFHFVNKDGRYDDQNPINHIDFNKGAVINHERDAIRVFDNKDLFFIHPEQRFSFGIHPQFAGYQYRYSPLGYSRFSSSFDRFYSYDSFYPYDFQTFYNTRTTVPI